MTILDNILIAKNITLEIDSLTEPKKDSTKRYEFGSFLNGAKAYIGYQYKINLICDGNLSSQQLTVSVGMDGSKGGKGKSIIVVRHDVIPFSVHSYGRHHWGQLGAVHIPTDTIFKPKMFGKKRTIKKRVLLAFVEGLIKDWKTSYLGGVISYANIPVTMSGRKTEYNMEDRLSIDWDALPLKYHVDDGVQNGNVMPGQKFLVQNFLVDGAPTSESWLRFEINTNGWWLDDDTGKWYETTNSSPVLWKESTIQEINAFYPLVKNFHANNTPENELEENKDSQKTKGNWGRNII